MAMSGTDKEIRTQTSSLPYNNHHHHHRDSSSSESMDHHHGSDPDHFPGSGAPAASATPISVGSRLLKSPPPPVRYRECLKNHAVNIGGNVTDGCGEFMPSGDDGTLEALKCAACTCHRNFHRKETNTTFHNPNPNPNPFLHLPPPLPSPTSMFHHHQQFHHHRSWGSAINAQPVKVAAESSSEELNFNTVGGTANAKRRFRTKFTHDQKEKMLEFAEKVGWRIPREDDAEVQRFCSEVGVKRQVLKVWMHNNKAISGSGKKQEEAVHQDSKEITID